VASIMGFDNQDFVTKMEGFAVQGMKSERFIPDYDTYLHSLI
jgi:hypothetical protein